MADKRYIVDDFEHCLGHAIEEAGEFLAAAGKTLRWGWRSCNPELAPADQEPNLAWMIREMRDLSDALARLQKVIDDGRLP